MRRPRISILQSMVAVACVALLIPFPWEVLAEALVSLAICYLIPTLMVIGLDSLRKRWLTILAFTILIGLMFLLILRDNSPSYHRLLLPSWLAAVITPIHLVGPIYVARQMWRKSSLNSGEILWVWSGLAWMNLMTIPIRSHYNPTISILVGSARVMSALAVALAVFTKRPTPPHPRWSYDLGWALTEYDAIVWGWYAADYLF